VNQPAAAPDPTRGAAALANRLRRRQRILGRWAARQGLEAWRIYDRDLPDFPLVVERYGRELAVVWLYERTRDDTPEAQAAWRDEALRGVSEGLGLSLDALAVKDRRRQRGRRADQDGPGQYERLGDDGRELAVLEDGLRFAVNLDDYLDTGLFVDHRALRRRVRSEAKGLRVLNLFAYTGSFTVHARAGGAAATTTVDLSNTYLGWLRRNLDLNGLGADDPRHEIIRADALAWLTEAPRTRAGTYDRIVLDPPTFSASTAMQQSFSVERDHPRLIECCRRLLAPGGILYFSTNARGFRLDAACGAHLQVSDITAATLDDDVKDRPPHRCWALTRPL
jgi:23S rRNA (cytosine1962-C5)-methyltransferase